MKKKRLLLITASSAAMILWGGDNSYAQVTKASLFTEANGYTEVKELPTDAAELSKYYYVIADANEEKMLQLVDGASEQNANGYAGTKAIGYVDVNDPFTNQGDVWIIEYGSDGYHIRSIAYSALLMQVEWNKAQYRHTNDQPHMCQWTKLNFAYTETKGWTIENGTYTSNYFGYWDKANGLNEINSGKTGDEVGHYVIYAIPRTDYMSKYASKNITEAGVDFTNFIINPIVKGVKAQYPNNIEGYTYTNSGGNHPAQYNDNCEFWNGTAANLSFNFSQTLSVPNGKYTLTASMYNSSNGVAGDAPNGNVGAFANDKFVGIEKDEETPSDYTIENINVTDGTLTLGYKTNGTPGARWFVGTGFKLTYHGEDLSVYQDALKETIEAAKAIKLEASDAANAALTSAIQTAEGVSQTDKDALVDGKVSLQTAIDNYNAYLELKTALAKYAKKTSFTVDFTLYDEAKAAYETATVPAAEVKKTYTDALLNAYRQYLRDIVAGYKNATAFVKNATVTGKIDRKDIEGWSRISNALNYGTSAQLNSVDYTGNYMENWQGSGLNEENISQTVTALPNGKYFLKMVAHTSADDAARVKDYVYIKSGDNESQGAILIKEVPSITITDPIEVTNGTAEIGVHVGSRAQWVAYNVVELYAYDIYDQTRTTATGKYGTICLPYNATVEGAKLYEANIDETNNVVNLTEVTGNTVKEGVAYIYEATADKQTFKFANDEDLVKDPATDGVLTGVFAEQQAPVNSYVLQQQSGETVQKFYKVADAQPTIKAYRAYLNAPATANAKALTINFGGATAVDAVKALTDSDAVIYDLNGNRLSKLQRGINIVNGVKVVIK